MLRRTVAIAVVALALLVILGVAALPAMADAPPQDASVTHAKVNAKDAAKALELRHQADTQMERDVGH